MSHQITVSEQMLELVRELDRYYYGDLQYCDSADWLKNVEHLNKEIANELRRTVTAQLRGRNWGALD